MAQAIQTVPASRATLWGSRAVVAIVTLFLLMDAATHLARPAPVVEAFARLGVPLGLAAPLGVLELVCLAAYVWPRSAPLGAILLTGYLGGAVAVNLRVGDPVFETLFPVIVGVLAWGGLFLRDSRVRALLPLRSRG